MTMTDTRRVDTGIVKRGDTYRFTVALGMDVNGKQIRKTQSFKVLEAMSEKKADKLAKEKYYEFKEKCIGMANLHEHMRFKDLVSEYRELYLSQLKPSTQREYNSKIDVHLMVHFGNMKLKDISTVQISRFFNTHLQQNTKHEQIPLNRSMAEELLGVLQSIFHFAVTQNYIKESPCRNVILPKKEITSVNKRRYLSEEELQIFLKLTSEYSPDNTAYKLLLYTGMRSGELLGLKWEDIDFEHKVIHIRRTLCCANTKHEYMLTSPKSKKSQRDIAIGDTVISLLKEHHKESLKKKLCYPDMLSDMVFTSMRGYYVNQCALEKKFKKLLKGSGLEFISLHSLRHSNATLLLSSGVDLKIVSEHLGHSEIGMTANVYADVLVSAKRKTADIIELSLAQ